MFGIGKTIAKVQHEVTRQVVNALTMPHRIPLPFGPTLTDRVSGRTVLITGASSGIGRALSLRLAAAGATVLVTARRTSELDQLVAQIHANGGKAFALPGDLSTTEGVDKLADQVLIEFGAPDILVNNAGRSIWRSVAESEHRLHDFERTMRINYFGPVGLVLRLLPEMRRRGSGHIVSSSSLGVITDIPRFAAYVGSKAALEAVMRIAANESHGDGVLFTDVRIPLVATDMSAALGWSGYKALSTAAAANMLTDAIIDRPAHLENLHGALSIWFNRLLPDLARYGLHQLHRMLPEETTAPSPSLRPVPTPEPAPAHD
ncbi:SDR family NAD(P)-dependent oxidoreductase [Nocardia sp. NPDC055321]